MAVRRFRVWRASAWAVALSALYGGSMTAAIGVAPVKPVKATLADYQRAQRYGSQAIGALVRGGGGDIHWVPGSDQFWFRRDMPDGRQFIMVDAASGHRGPAFDHDRLAAALSGAVSRKVSAKRLPFTAIVPSANGTSVIFRYGNRWWRCDLRSYVCEPSEAPKAPAPPVAPTLPALATDPLVSPDGARRIVVRNANIGVLPASGGAEVALTTNGSPDDYYQFLGWAPDSRHVVACRTRPGEHRVMYNVESMPEGQLRPRLIEHLYDLPGDRVDVHDLWILDADKRTAAHVDTEAIDYDGPHQIRWRLDGRHFTFEQTFRGFHRERIVEVDAETAASRTIVDERSETFVFPPVRFVQYLDATGEILWTSERDGWNHIYLYDERTGQVKSQVTRGEWVVRAIESVDEKARQIVFAASGREPGQNPYLIHYYRVSFDGTGLVPLTPANGHHTVRFSPDRKYLLDTYSRVDAAPVTEVRRVSDGSPVCEVDRADVSALLKIGWRFPESFHAKARDGKTDIWGVIYRPSNLDPKRKYPVIEENYAGPQGSSVPTSFSAQRGPQALAELGFIVVQLDGLGMGCRSKVFHDVCYKNLGDSGFPDRILWMRAAARKYPYMDLTRVGIYGMSAGGYNAAHALIAHPEFYKVAVAEAGNHDHRTDKLWWNEMWMGYPVGPHYIEQSNIEQAAKLRGKLLLVHGELDDNVNPFASTMRFVSALMKANKRFDMLLVPGAGHGFGLYVQQRMWDYFVRNLQGAEPPESFVLANAADGSVTVQFRNLMDRTVSLFWVTSDGARQPYGELHPGQTRRQHTFVGHEWEAQIDGVPVSSYVGAAESPVWDIVPEK